jgi:hypothetical protein
VLQVDIEQAMQLCGVGTGRSWDEWSAESLALHTQVVIQGACVLAKAKLGVQTAADSLDHLRRYRQSSWFSPVPHSNSPASPAKIPAPAFPRSSTTEDYAPSSRSSSLQSQCCFLTPIQTKPPSAFTVPAVPSRSEKFDGEAVTPFGNPITVPATVPANPLSAVAVTVIDLLVEATMLTAVRQRSRTRSHGNRRNRRSPIRRSRKRHLRHHARRQRVLEAPCVTPAGSPLTVTVTTTLKPFSALALTSKTSLAPAASATLCGLAFRLKSGVGVIGAATIVAMAVAAVEVRLKVSVTVNEIVYVPAAAYVCLGLTPVPVALSPKFQAYVSASPCGSVDTTPVKLTAVPAWPV